MANETRVITKATFTFSRRPASSPDPVLNSGGFFTSSSSYTTDNIEDGNITRISSASFKPSSSNNNSLSYVTMPRGNDAKKWRDVEENNNVDVFPSRTGDLTNSHEWNPDIISGVVRPPEQIKLVQDLEAIRAVSSLSSSTEPSVHVRAPSDSRGFVDKPRPIGRGGRRLTTGSIGSEEEFNMANGDASSSDSAPSVTHRPALQQFKRQKEQAAVEATKEPKPIRPAAPPLFRTGSGELAGRLERTSFSTDPVRLMLFRASLCVQSSQLALFIDRTSNPSVIPAFSALLLDVTLAILKGANCEGWAQ